MKRPGPMSRVMKQFWHVTLPGLRSVLIVVILLRDLMFNKFDVIWLLTKGGPLNETETLPTLAYRKAFLGSTGRGLSPPSRS